MRRLLLLAPLLALFLAPGSAIAGTCPAAAGDLVDKASYRLGELIDFYGTYNDFADPGKVTIQFERTTDGARRGFNASNSPDGSWYLRLTLNALTDVGRWNVTAVVTQTGTTDSCTDRLTIRARSTVPDTATGAAAFGRNDAGGPVTLAIAALVAALLALRRPAGVRSRDR